MLVCESFKKNRVRQFLFVVSISALNMEKKKNQTNLHRLNITTSVLANLV